MNFDHLKAELRTAKLIPIHVKDSPLDKFARELDFVGSFQEYIEAVTVIGIPYVLVLTEILDGDRFLYLGDEDLDFREGLDEIDLLSIAPALKKFEKRIGQIGMLKLLAPMGEKYLAYYINEDWWLEFIKLWEEATEQVESDRTEAETRARESRESEDRRLLGALSELIHDQHFVSLPTQRAMIAYAGEHIPELDQIDDNILRAEIQTLSAKIKAKGLGRKR